MKKNKPSTFSQWYYIISHIMYVLLLEYVIPIYAADVLFHGYDKLQPHQYIIMDTVMAITATIYNL